MNGFQERIFKTKKTALIAVLIAFELACALPAWIFFMYGLHAEGKLTIDIAIYMTILCVAAGAAAGFLFWRTVLEPIRVRKFGQPGPTKKDGAE